MFMQPATKENEKQTGKKKFRTMDGVPKLQMWTHSPRPGFSAPSHSKENNRVSVCYLEESTGSGAGIGLGTEAEADLALVFSVPYFE